MLGSQQEKSSAFPMQGSVAGILITTFYFISELGTLATLRFGALFTCFIGFAGLLFDYRPSLKIFASHDQKVKDEPGKVA